MENPEKTQDEFNAVTSVLSTTPSSTHDGKHQGTVQGYDFTRTFAKLCKPEHIKTFA